MTEQQEHLKSAIDQQASLIDEIQKINNNLTSKREFALKLQGIIEYLTGLGVTLPVQEAQQEEAQQESLEEVEV